MELTEKDTRQYYYPQFDRIIRFRFGHGDGSGGGDQPEEEKVKTSFCFNTV